MMQPADAVRVTGSVVLNFQQCQIMWGALRFLLWLLVVDDESPREGVQQVGRCKTSRNGDHQKHGHCDA